MANPIHFEMLGMTDAKLEKAKNIESETARFFGTTIFSMKRELILKNIEVEDLKKRLAEQEVKS